ncbi:hypothetical protein dqs_0604 [Azoarcus olearius]|uniref:DUF7940 domain-containing protein n=1 Tax=Azoarcus sp. (strain BH72) TaxID=418699 RepID=UPI000806323A|nr:hypothetical protein [Azoarcus olearius]ANQ83680.1 hypothetical protein dqs_0604 [Azoarcus olearius]
MEPTPALDDCKCWWKSRTLQLNALAAALIAAEAAFGILQPMLPVNFYRAMAFVLPIANAVLRVMTTQAVRL